MAQNSIAKNLNSTELQALFDRIEINQTVRKGSHTGRVVDKFNRTDAPPEIWVLWHGSNLPVPELPSSLQLGKKTPRGLKPEIDKCNCSDNHTEVIKSELNREELTTIPWNDQLNWGSDEPLIPDDVWQIGEKVRWKRNGREGSVVGVLKEPILGGQLNYVVVRWFDTNQTLPIEPYSLWRLRSASTSEFNPIEPSEGKSSIGLNQGGEFNPIEPSEGKSSIGLNQGGEFNPIEPSEEKSSIGLNQGEEFNPIEPSEEKSSIGLNQGEEFNPIEPSGEKSSIGLNEETKRRGARGKQLASGWLHSYTKNKKLKSGIIATYPKVERYRDPDNIDHWYWGYKYEVKIDGDWKTKTLPVPRFRVATVRFMIEDGMSVAAIKALIKGEFAND